MNRQPTDEELVARHLRGQAEAFGELVSRYAGRLFNLAYRFTGDPAEAEDLAQEAFLRAWAALPRSQAERPFRPWLFQIAVNLCRDWARRKRPLAFADLRGGPEGDEAEDDAAERLPAEGASPEELAEQGQQAEALRRAVMALPAGQRLVVTLRYTEGLSYDEIGRLLNMPSQTVGTSLLRARRKLRAMLAKPPQEAGHDPTS